MMYNQLHNQLQVTTSRSFPLLSKTYKFTIQCTLLKAINN